MDHGIEPGGGETRAETRMKPGPHRPFHQFRLSLPSLTVTPPWWQLSGRACWPGPPWSAAGGWDTPRSPQCTADPGRQDPSPNGTASMKACWTSERNRENLDCLVICLRSNWWPVKPSHFWPRMHCVWGSGVQSCKAWCFAGLTSGSDFSSKHKQASTWCWNPDKQVPQSNFLKGHQSAPLTVMFCGHIFTLKMFKKAQNVKKKKNNTKIASQEVDAGYKATTVWEVKHWRCQN